jgi:hypothetical protein
MSSDVIELSKRHLGLKIKIKIMRWVCVGVWRLRSEHTIAKDCRNALVAAYTATVGPGPTEERDPMNRMRPPVRV